MSEDQAIMAVYSIGCLVLVGSSLVARRLPLKEWVRMSLAWAAIFGAAFFAVMFINGLMQ